MTTNPNNPFEKSQLIEKQMPLLKFLAELDKPVFVDHFNLFEQIIYNSDEFKDAPDSSIFVYMVQSFREIIYLNVPEEWQKITK